MCFASPSSFFYFPFNFIFMVLMLNIYNTHIRLYFGKKEETQRAFKLIATVHSIRNTLSLSTFSSLFTVAYFIYSCTYRNDIDNIRMGYIFIRIHQCLQLLHGTPRLAMRFSAECKQKKKLLNSISF